MTVTATVHTWQTCILPLKMLERSLKGNDVQKMVEEEGLLNKRSVFKKVDMNTSDTAVPLPEFPMLSMEKLREITFGIYQLKEAKNYVLDNFTEDQFEVFVCNSVENLLRVKLRSRHSNSVRHSVYPFYFRWWNSWLVLHMQSRGTCCGMLCPYSQCPLVSWILSISRNWTSSFKVSW